MKIFDEIDMRNHYNAGYWIGVAVGISTTIGVGLITWAYIHS